MATTSSIESVSGPTEKRDHPSPDGGVGFSAEAEAPLLHRINASLA